MPDFMGLRVQKEEVQKSLRIFFVFLKDLLLNCELKLQLQVECNFSTARFARK